MACAEATLCAGKIAWKQKGEWMNLPQFVADNTICELPAGLLSKLMTAMSIKGHGKLSHKLKAELFLRTVGKTNEEVEEILADLKVRTRKTKQDAEGDEEDGGDAYEEWSRVGRLEKDQNAVSFNS